VKVVFFVGTLQAGGLERFVTRVCVEAKAKGLFEPVVVCLRKRTGVFLATLEQSAIPVYVAPRKWDRSPLGWIRLVKLLRLIDGDIVHSQVNFSLIQQFSAVVLAGMKYLVTERNCYSRSGLALYRRKIQYRVLKAFDVQYSANSRRVAEHLATMLNEPVDRFQVFPNGIAIEPGDVTGVKQPGLPVTIAYVARMAEHKGHLFFLEVLEKLAGRSIPLKAILIGDGPLRHAIERVVMERKLTEVVNFTGIVPNVEDYMRDADIVALFSDYEGMPNVIIEAMARGRPVVATDTGNVRELLETGAGVVLDKKDVEQAANELEFLARNPGKRSEMGKTGQFVISQRYTLASVLERLAENYRKQLQA
jgi:glycosyltransferase involved in cell wall biosynthesis